MYWGRVIDLPARLHEDCLVDSPSGSAQDDYRRLESPNPWLGRLLGPSSGQTLRRALQEDLARQVPGSQIEWLQVVDDPVFLTGVVASPEDIESDTELVKTTLRRAALAAPFALSVVTPDGHRYALKGD
jgi:hypothetical protein